MLLVLAVLAAPAATVAAASRTVVERARLANGDRAVLVDKRDIYLETVPKPGEGLITFSRRVTGSPNHAAEVGQTNGNVRRLLSGVLYRVPYRLLPPERQLAVVRALFPGDKGDKDGWQHRTRGESLDKVAEWFTAGPNAVASLRRGNKLGAGRLPAETTVRIANEILRAPFRSPGPAPTQAKAGTPAPAQVPPVAPVSAFQPAPGPTLSAAPPGHAVAPAGGPAGDLAVGPARDGVGAPSSAPPVEPTIGAESVIVGGAGTAAVPGVGAPSPPPQALLQYGEDAQGKFAIYPLHAGEALYSSVVMRFTGRLHSEDVRSIASDIAARSGIADVTSIPIGFPVRIPFDVLLPEFLPPNDPRRLEYEVERRLSGQYKNEVKARGLDGVTVVLDAGHGGIDVGASMAGVWESLYVYDITLRVKKTLETETRARVVMTTRDGAAWTIADRDVLPFSRGHAVLTTPPFPITDTVIGVNLRWYLANSQYRQAKTKGSSPDKVVFISIHADSLHPSLRGATAYIPDAAGTAGTTRKSGAAFTARKEVREQPQVQFSLQERQRSEGLSRDLAEQIIGAFRKESLGVHPFNPVRDRIFRGRRAWVPAVLRYNAIPAKLLLEVCNLANLEDRTLLTTRAFRQRVAGSVIEGLLSYFGAPR
ncbi:MAG: N-acetylmuramoyl-L-alanine amidase [Thermoanaerobaculia bacterium]